MNDDTSAALHRLALLGEVASGLRDARLASGDLARMVWWTWPIGWQWMPQRRWTHEAVRQSTHQQRSHYRLTAEKAGTLLWYRSLLMMELTGQARAAIVPMLLQRSRPHVSAAYLPDPDRRRPARIDC